MDGSDPLENLKAAFQALPGIGPRSASRIVSQLLSRDRAKAQDLAQALEEALSGVRQCALCNRLCSQDICALCASTKRDSSKLCVVQSDADLELIEQTMTYDGRYFVLTGVLNPVQGIGPEEIGLEKLIARLGSDTEIEEVILAMAFTPEGEATAHFIASFIKRRMPRMHVTRLSRGLPAGIELEYTDANTVANAIFFRKEKS